ncbi:MAG: IPT/TIG domain-containing protein [Alphaproteobacteria bacterium]|nr:IPT/TIG domain-containing protein [Alphaproteobacteria bacterium]
MPVAPEVALSSPAALALLVAASLSGCGLGGLSAWGTGSDTGVTDDHGPVWVDEVEPNWGPTDGGTRVVIRGGGFEGEVGVRFGGADLTVTVINDGEVVVFSPEAAVETGVDVTVTSDLGEFVVPGGFTYSDSGPPTGGDSGSSDGGGGDGGSTGGDGGGGDGGGDGGGGGSAAGKVSGLVEYYYEVIACPSCFGVTEQLNIGGSARFHSPLSGSWNDWMPAKGSCSSSSSAGELTSSTEDVGDWVYIESGSTSVGLRRVTAGGQVRYEATGLTQAQYVRNASWDVNVASGSWGGFEAPGVLKTVSDGFDDVQPVAILEDGTRAFSATIRAANATLTWAPTGISDSFITILGVYRAADGSYIGQVLCHTDDTGSVTIPASMLSSFPTGSLLAVYMYRYQLEDGINPVDGSTIEGVTMFGLIGTGTLR